MKINFLNSLKLSALIMSASITIGCQSNPPQADHKNQPSISTKAQRYGDIDVTRPELQIPTSVKPLFDHWLRDTYVNLGHDGYYYMTGTVGMPGRKTAYDDSPGVKLWRSKNLKDWENMGVVFDLYKTDTWQGDYHHANDKRKVDLNGNKISQKRRTLWAPEIHYIKSQKTYFIVASVPENPNGRGSYILRSTSGKAEGPYVNIEGNKDGPIYPNIDGSLFEDDDGTVYFIGHNHFIAKMKADMSGIAEPFTRLAEKPYEVEPYIEGAYMFKEDGKYHLVQAIWSFKLPDGRFAYDEEKPGRAFETRKEIGEARYSYDVVIATADTPYGPFSKRYTSVIGAGHNNFFKDKDGNWWCTMFGNPRGDILERSFLTRPAIIPMRKVKGKFYPIQD
ncbi:family 43 glycosylhydrolase [Catenovulum adriaticum]|uniref:Family 43 glycosylhydrolase n=1 Tax=Catenovulum adriaticum TaxID=2984846 RepID=A0ABY7AR85_9ALTE|nr:family 43 glycosylhydrolase [Catenovulum sp. TS8]WAJ71835.1 family 43 glycosylhydrolase [Catenovulum sp. TS8]